MVDSHVVKMVLETAQLLSTAHHVYHSPQAPDVYKPTHVNHPSAVWCRATSLNYNWLWQHFIALSDEYTHRYGREHKAFINTFMLLEANPCPAGPLTVPATAVTDDLKPKPGYSWADAVLAYREYYRRDKADLHKYTNRMRPVWL
jgi:hypothetical protein